jgi:hypothetical protein
MCDTYVQHQRQRTRRVHEVTRQLNVPTSLTPTPSHLLCFHFVGCEKEVSNLINHPVVSLLGIRVGGTSAEVVPIDSPRVSIWNFLQSQVDNGNSVRVGILALTQESKNVYQRLGDQVSSLWWVLIYPNQLMYLKYKTRPGTSSSSDSKFSISVSRTESWTVTTTRYCAHNRICSTRHETTKVCLRPLKDCHMMRIWCVSLFWAGMTVTLESSSPHTM